MHFNSILFFAASALQISSSLAQAGSCPTALATYAPAQAYCSARYPIKTVTVTVPRSQSTTTAKTTTGSIKTTTAITTKNGSVSTTTPAADNGGSTKTITSIVEKTVTNCRDVTVPTNCKLKIPTGIPGLGPRAAEPEPEPVAEPQGFGANSPMYQLASIIAKGSNAVKSACSCIQPPAKTVTVTAR